MATKDPEVIAHQQWLGYVQPVGLVVSIPAMVQAQAYVNRNIAPDHQRFLDCLTDDDKSPPAIADLARFTQEVLGWEPTDLVPWSVDNPGAPRARSRLDGNGALEEIGREYYEFRAALMVRNNEGLTKTYNRFHDPHETSPDILELRELHAAMDRAVLEAYGWHDLAEKAACEFLLDYEDEEDEELSVVSGPSSVAKTSRRKKPWRYRWPDEFRDEVLARLLALNKERAEQERLAGKAGEAADGKKAGRKRLTGGRKSSKKNAAQGDLPGV